MAEVKREHRAQAHRIRFPSGICGPLDVAWIETGHPADSYRQHERIAQALADTEEVAYNRGAQVCASNFAKRGLLRDGCWYVITDIDPNDPDPSLSEGDEVLCAEAKPGCVSPENHNRDGMGTQWFADFDPEEGAYRTLITGIAFLRGPETAGEKDDSNG